MANPTTNYGFVLPTPTDLVTDLPADFDVALQGVDTRMKALEPATTLGDLQYRSSTANTNLRLGIGTTGQNLTVVAGVPAWTTPAAMVSASNFVSTQQSTTSITYTGLTTAQSVTLTTGTKVMVIVGAGLQTTTAEERGFMSYSISGATTSAASDDFAVVVCSSTAFDNDQSSYVSFRTVTAGSNTFTAQFRQSASTTVEAKNRTLIVLDLGS